MCVCVCVCVCVFWAVLASRFRWTLFLYNTDMMTMHLSMSSYQCILVCRHIRKRWIAKMQCLWYQNQMLCRMILPYGFPPLLYLSEQAASSSYKILIWWHIFIIWKFLHVRAFVPVPACAYVHVHSNSQYNDNRNIFLNIHNAINRNFFSLSFKHTHTNTLHRTYTHNSVTIARGQHESRNIVQMSIFANRLKA